MTPLTREAEPLELSRDELAFFRLTFDLFPTLESPLRFLEEQDAEPADPEATFTRLSERGLLNAAGTGAADSVRDRLAAVAECSARVRVSVCTSDSKRTRDFYLSPSAAVEYACVDGAHVFGPVRSESALAVELAQSFHTAPEGVSRSLNLSAGDYLVFAVFARDTRGSAEVEQGPGDPMSIEEVLAYFDEPETKVVRTPNDESWQRSVQSLAAQRVLVKREHGYEVHPSLHALAREIVADHQHNVVRFDFLDDQWLVREVSLYPTPDSVYRLGTEPDGSVLIQELSASSLADVLAGVVVTLPNLLHPEVQPSLKQPGMRG